MDKIKSSERNLQKVDTLKDFEDLGLISRSGTIHSKKVHYQPQDQKTDVLDKTIKTETNQESGWKNISSLNNRTNSAQKSILKNSIAGGFRNGGHNFPPAPSIAEHTKHPSIISTSVKKPPPVIKINQILPKTSLSYNA